jgi:hypothetical protein
MKYVAGLAVVVACLALGACGLFAPEDSTEQSQPSASSPAVFPEATPATPAGAAPATTAPAAPVAPPPTAPAAPAAPAEDRDAVCGQAARCCAAAFATPGLAPMFAGQREAACSAVQGTAIDAAGCRLAMESWRGMVSSVPGATVPADCN